MLEQRQRWRWRWDRGGDEYVIGRLEDGGEVEEGRVDVEVE